MKKILFLMALLSASSVSARVLDGVTVDILGLDSNFPNVVFVRIKEPANAAPHASCHSNAGWSYVLHLNSSDRDKMYAMLLAGKHSGTPLRLSGSNTCHSTNIEYLSVLYSK